jgi:RNA polymerase sigma-70 factor (ECF subfamily)
MVDTTEFERVAMPYLQDVYRAAVALSGNRDRGEDLAQATFLKALTRFETFKIGTNCKAWLMRILRNTWVDELRHRKVVGPEVSVEENLLPGTVDAERTSWSDATDLLENFADEQVIRALGELPDDQRLTLFLVDVEDMPQDEVAGILGVAIGTIKSRASRARAALRDRLEAHAKDLGFLGRG